MNSRIYAIIETDGRTEIVQPGDMLKDRLARVERIDRDQVVLKTTGPKPRRIVVRFSGSPKTGNQTGGMMPGGMMPGGMGPGAMAPGIMRGGGMQGRGRLSGGPM